MTCKNRLPYNLYSVGGDVKHCTINQGWYDTLKDRIHTIATVIQKQLFHFRGSGLKNV